MHLALGRLNALPAVLLLLAVGAAAPPPPPPASNSTAALATVPFYGNRTTINVCTREHMPCEPPDFWPAALPGSATTVQQPTLGPTLAEPVHAPLAPAVTVCEGRAPQEYSGYEIALFRCACIPSERLQRCSAQSPVRLPAAHLPPHPQASHASSPAPTTSFHAAPHASPTTHLVCTACAGR